MEIGIYTFVDRTPDPQTGQTISAAQRLADLLEEVELADQVGLDVFAVGEHHRPEYVASAPAVILGAAAARTKNIRLSSAVTVLSSDDPVRVFQQFSTVDLLSGGRAEIMAGRGSFIESFPLFGYSLDDYDSLFSEKLEMLLEIRSNEKLNWKGKHRAPVKGLGVYPRPLQDPLPVWIAVGGTPGSVIRAGKLGLPIAFAIIGGDPRQFAPLVQLYRDTGEAAGFARDQLQVSINSHAFVADTSQAAADIYYGPYAYVMSKIGQERGWPPMNRAQFERMRAPGGSLLVGDPQEVIDKILYEHELFGHDRFLAQMEVGTMPHKELMRAIELLGTKVAPAIHKALGK
ncbi:LLM class flavin-dependent oxidoreductase [Terrimonas ferruginea]|uniref:LLM class flavin-dependent oxidoreductase n=1 Tax=Terrimonas ferruginea TaxID=249 RepID=UPI000424F0C7|nr:LLM class flavin-dependent oxidoreductase [Terrimonas ferruginea]